MPACVQSIYAGLMQSQGTAETCSYAVIGNHGRSRENQSTLWQLVAAGEAHLNTTLPMAPSLATFLNISSEGRVGGMRGRVRERGTRRGEQRK